MAHEANASLTNGHTEPHYGSRLLPQVVDELAESNPSRVYAIYPFTSDLSKGFRHVTMGELAQAVNKVAFWLDDTTGRSTTFETIAYMGPSDIRYTIFFLAAIKCGYKFFCATQMEFIVQDLKQSVQNMAIYSVESLDNMLDGASKRYPYEVTYKDACWDPILVLQSSGSTGQQIASVDSHVLILHDK
ncbi:uncharacterized protein KY384_001328 [Bacidia gigantensis]|uniref:uncharacterized protein n=1 Tax=Bacidia gigantensis TaxID=2732470 RepID=UPI001D04009B|nr:uncharacterized protein KY384_001328 [Bacidia gigantensis]KAG8533588.1 hypothetical protein KY384_001328 [Bacidia gigantensis]